MNDAVSLFPAPPDHYRVFFAPNALQPPSPALLEAAEVYPTFGRPVPNIKRGDRKFEAPPIDPDVLMYNRDSADLGAELKSVASQLPAAIDEIFAAVILEPETVNRPLRRVDNIVKNIFHICEVARNTREPYEVAVLLAKRRLQEKQKMLEQLKEAVEATRVAAHLDESSCCLLSL